jgi:hypothetical protein
MFVIRAEVMLCSYLSSADFLIRSKRQAATAEKQTHCNNQKQQTKLHRFDLITVRRRNKLTNVLVHPCP